MANLWILCDETDNVRQTDRTDDRISVVFGALVELVMQNRNYYSPYRKKIIIFIYVDQSKNKYSRNNGKSRAKTCVKATRTNNINSL